MTRLLDERYLTVHPRTALWWAQREQCGKCLHHAERDKKVNGGNSGSGGGNVCTQYRRRTDTSCISAREPGMPCGPDARLFVPRETA